MRSALASLSLALLAATRTSAHEFWLEPEQMMLDRADTASITVQIGEGLMGETYPFQPRAYQSALWVGPNGVLSLHRQPISAGDMALTVLGDGMHILAVASYGQQLTYPSLDAFHTFAREIGAAPVLSTFPPVAETDGTVRETYRRFSKTYVHFGARIGSDLRLGLAREWVMTPAGFRLFDGPAPAARHTVDLWCRATGDDVKHMRVLTGDDGRIPMNPPVASRCLLNAVFLDPPQAGGTWSSDWASAYWLSAPIAKDDQTGHD